VAREVGEVLGVDGTHLGRYDEDEVISVAQWGRDETVAIGARFRLDGDSISARVRRTGAPARMDGDGEAPGAIADEVRRIGIYCSIGVPITVEGQPWGVMIASSRTADPFPTEAESRLQSFTELVATAVRLDDPPHRRGRAPGRLRERDRTVGEPPHGGRRPLGRRHADHGRGPPVGGR
jgi:transcriptional regulator with GAF, ATPase, and Fis domain